MKVPKPKILVGDEAYCPTKFPRLFLRQVFNEAIDDKDDVATSINQRLELVDSKLTLAGGEGTLQDCANEFFQAMDLLDETIQIARAYRAILGSHESG